MISKFFDRTAAFYCRHEYLLIIGFVLIWQTVLICASNGLFVDSDSYTHAMRLTDLIQSGSWRETLYRHDNCPFGQILHFTRLTDMFLYLTTFPFLPFLSVKKAVLTGGFLYNPLIACLSAAGLIWGGKAFVGPLLRASGVLFYFAQGAVFSLFFAGRPDHHVLLNLLLIFLTGCLLHGTKTQKSAYYKTAGILGGLSVWATPEGFLSCGFILAGLILAWLFRFQNMRRLRVFSQFLFLTTAAGWIVNPPMQGLFHPDNGRLSVLIVVMLGLAFISFYIAELLENGNFFHSRILRLSFIPFAACLSLAVTLLLFGFDTVFSSPIPSEIHRIWTVHITELQPGFTGELFHSAISIPFYVLLIAVPVFFQASKQTKKILTIIGTPLIFFTILTAMVFRFCRPCAVFAVYVLLPSLGTFFSSFSFKNLQRLKIFSAVFLLLIYTASVKMSYGSQQDYQSKRTDPAEYLPYISASSGCILTSSSMGPETAWGTNGSVVGSPYHSNAHGITDAYNILHSADMEEVKRLLKKRSVGTIILTNPHYSVRKQKTAEKSSQTLQRHIEARTFFGRLVSEASRICFITPPPAFPDNLKEKYLIYFVDFKHCNQNNN